MYSTDTDIRYTGDTRLQDTGYSSKYRCRIKDTGLQDIQDTHLPDLVVRLFIDDTILCGVDGMQSDFCLFTYQKPRSSEQCFPLAETGPRS